MLIYPSIDAMFIAHSHKDVPMVKPRRRSSLVSSSDDLSSDLSSDDLSSSDLSLAPFEKEFHPQQHLDRVEEESYREQRCVRFAPMPAATTSVLGLVDYTIEEHEACWYYPEELYKLLRSAEHRVKGHTSPTSPIYNHTMECMNLPFHLLLLNHRTVIGQEYKLSLSFKEVIRK